MKKGSIGMALFTGLFVGIVVFLSNYLIPNASLITSVIIAGLSALVGGLIGNKLFPNISWRNVLNVKGALLEQQLCFPHCANGADYGGIEMAKFIDDLAGAIYDFFKFIFTSICYLVAGMVIAGFPLYLIALVFSMLN